MNSSNKISAFINANPRRITIIIIAIIATLTGILYFSQSGNATRNANLKVDPAYGEYISAYTAGIISKESTIRLRLAQEFQENTVAGSEADAGVLKFNPPIKGKAYWSDSKTLEFKPDELLASGQLYKAVFSLGDILEVPDELSAFEFEFQTMEQNFEVLLGGLSVYEKTNLKRQKYAGSIYTADVADNEKVEELMGASQNGQPLKITWNHLSDRHTHEFIVEEVIRGETAGQLSLSWNGDALEVNNEGNENIEIPAIGDFKLVNGRVIQSPDQYISLMFSDPLKEKQNLEGLITIDNVGSLRYIIEDNEIKVYPSVRQTGNKNIEVHAGILNILDYKMKKATSISLAFEQVKPAVRLVGKGVILPSTDGLVLPFEAVSLKAVNIQVTKIYEENVFQFLQVNNLEGSREIHRVGRPLLKKTISLENRGVSDLGKWNRFTLDLDQMIESEPGAIYQVQFSFNKNHSSYDCPGSVSDDDMQAINEQNWDELSEDEFSYWDYYEDDYYYDPDYDWNERENPCHSSYYAYGRRTSSRNILASNLGVLAKIGNNRELKVAVTDLRTTNPLSGVSVEVYDFQQQLIANALTDADGFVEIGLEKKPFLIIANHDGEKGYLKIDDGNALSLSNFDVSGQVIQKGIKGFIYGERGVWRPGDDIYLTFILEDKENKLPENHPVILEFYNPRGQLKEKLVRTKAVGDMYHFTTKTDENDLTGNWRASVKVGGATFNKTVKIETIKPNRLKINLDFGKEKIVPGNQNISGNLNVKWLHGAPAGNLKAEFDVVLTPTTTSFSKYEAYSFDDPSRDFYGESERIFEGQVDANGNATISAELTTDYDPPGMLTAHFKGKVFESAGGFSIDRFSIPYYPYSSFVGIKTPKGDKARGMLLTDTTHTVDIVTVDTDGKGISRSGLKLELYKLEWRWWWDQSENSISNYIGRSSTTPIAVGVVKTSGGKGTWNFKVDYPQWGRFFLRATDPISGHSTGKIIYMDWPGWAGRAQREFPGGASMLAFSADKEKYSVGETVKLSIPASGEGRALVSIENGSGVIEQHWVSTNKGETPFMFNVTEEMAPNIYVNISLLQPHGQTANDLPIRLYGIVPLTIDNNATHLNPVIKMADELEPETTVKIQITEKDGKPMAYTVAVVDEGLLDITRFKTPDAWKSFYAREALGVKTWDVYEEVIGAFGGRLERLIAIGGDGEANAESAVKVNRFKPVVQYIGPFFLEAGETAHHEFTMPQYIGSVKTMVVAAHNGAYGKTDNTTPVRQSLMVLGTLPRVLGPGEEVVLPANVFVSDAAIKNVKVEVEKSDIFELKGGAEQTATFNQPTDQIVNFGLKVKPQIGPGKVSLKATSGNKTSNHEIEIMIRNPNPPVTNIIEKVIPAGSSWETDFQNVGMKGTNSGMLEIYSVPPINLDKRLKYLLRYPHGCVEQTISAVFPQLYLSEITEVNETAKAMIQKNITAGISKLSSFQHSDGGFSYWPGTNYRSDWSTSYAGHFLLEAQERGYHIPNDMIRKWKNYQRKAARNWRKESNYQRSDLVQAYRLYTLALGDAPEKGAMNRLRERNDLSKTAKWRLAASYQLSGQEEAAKALIANQSTTVSPYVEQSYTYGSHARDEAMILETLMLLGEKEKAFIVMKKLSEYLSDNSYWMSTQTTAFCLIAASKYLKSEKPEGGMSFSYVLNGGNKVNASTEMTIAQSELKVDGKTSGNMHIENTSNNQLYARILLEGTPVVGDESMAENNLRVRTVYKDNDGNIIDPSSLSQGTNFVAEVTVSNPGYRGHYKELALTQIFPSGWEILNSNLDAADFVGEMDKPAYQDIRDDRIYTYFDLNANKRKTFKVLLNASYAGKFYLPTIACEAMYDNSINARQPGKWVEVTKPGVQ